MADENQIQAQPGAPAAVEGGEQPQTENRGPGARCRSPFSSARVSGALAEGPKRGEIRENQAKSLKILDHTS